MRHEEAAQHEEAVRQRSTPAAPESLAASPGPLTALPEQLVALLAEAQALAQQGGLSKRATEAQKWQAADLVHALQRAVETQRDRLLDPFTPATPEAKASFQRSSLAYDAFLETQERTRGTLVDAALTAATFPPGHPVRQGALSFSHARTLSRLRTEWERTIWAARAAREGLSVARLWALILTEDQTAASRTRTEASGHEASGHEAAPSARSGFSARGLPAEEEVQNAAESQNNTDARNEASFLSESELLSELELISESEAFVNVMRPRDRRHHAHVCALTGQAIGDLAAIAEVRVGLEPRRCFRAGSGRHRKAGRRVGG